MLMGMSAEEKKLLGLGTPSEYHYLTMVSPSRPSHCSVATREGQGRSLLTLEFLQLQKFPNSSWASEAGLMVLLTLTCPRSFCVWNQLFDCQRPALNSMPPPTLLPPLPRGPPGDPVVFPHKPHLSLVPCKPRLPEQ